MSNTTVVKRIKAKTDFHGLTAQNLLLTGLKIAANFFASTFFTIAAGAPAPPVDQATMNASNDELQNAIVASATGAKATIAALKPAKEAVATKLDLLANYVSVYSKG